MVTLAGITPFLTYFPTFQSNTQKMIPSVHFRRNSADDIWVMCGTKLLKHLCWEEFVIPTWQHIFTSLSSNVHFSSPGQRHALQKLCKSKQEISHPANMQKLGRISVCSRQKCVHTRKSSYPSHWDLSGNSEVDISEDSEQWKRHSVPCTDGPCLLLSKASKAKWNKLQGSHPSFCHNFCF